MSVSESESEGVGGGAAGGGGRGGADTELKTKTPHVNVGNNRSDQKSTTPTSSQECPQLDQQYNIVEALVVSRIAAIYEPGSMHSNL